MNMLKLCLSDRNDLGRATRQNGLGIRREAKRETSLARGSCSVRACTQNSDCLRLGRGVDLSVASVAERLDLTVAARADVDVAGLCGLGRNGNRLVGRAIRGIVGLVRAVAWGSGGVINGEDAHGVRRSASDNRLAGHTE